MELAVGIQGLGTQGKGVAGLCLGFCMLPRGRAMARIRTGGRGHQFK